MTRFHRWKSSTAALMAMAITTGAVVPMFTSTPATAQAIFGGRSRAVSIPRRVTLPITYEKDKIVVTPDETTPITLTIASNIIDNNRNVLIPRGTEVVGKLEPQTVNGEKGSRFVAQELIFPNGQRQNIDAISRTITRKETITKGADTGKVLTDAAYGAGAAAVISLITGNRKIDILEPIGGAAAGALASVLLRKKSAEVVVINPQTDLDLVLQSDLVISRN